MTAIHLSQKEQRNMRRMMIDTNIILDVLMGWAHDFEDCLLATCAKSNQCEGIITRNTKDFLFSEIPTVTPDEFLNNAGN